MQLSREWTHVRFYLLKVMSCRITAALVNDLWNETHSCLAHKDYRLCWQLQRLAAIFSGRVTQEPHYYYMEYHEI